MAISSETTWSLVVCGLIAHADGVLDGEECELLLAMIEDEADADEYSEWLGTIGDREALQRMLDDLPEPDPQQSRDLLEQAWSMALVDGDRCDEEVRVLEHVGERLGVEPMQLQFWREAWATSEREFAGLAASALVSLVARDGALVAKDGELLEDMIARLPTTEDHREELLESSTAPMPVEDVGRRLASLSRRKRIQLLRLLAPLVHESSQADAASERWVQLAQAAGIDEEKAQSVLQGAGEGR